MKQSYIILAVLLSWTLLTGCMKPQATSPPANNAATSPRPALKFVVAADPQLFRGKKADLDEAVMKINQLKPDFVVMCGDLIENPANLKQIQAYQASVSKLSPDIKLYNVSGNHDLGRPSKPEHIQVYQQHFGPLWYHFEYAEALFIVLSSDVLQNDAIPLYQQQRKWLIGLLGHAQSESQKQIFVFMHHPLYLNSPDEPDAYSNMPIHIRSELLNLFVEHDVRAVFSGHYHNNKMNRYQGVDLITTNSITVPMGNTQAGFRVVEVQSHQYEQQYYTIEQLEKQERE